MQVVLLLVVGSVVAGLFFEKLDRKAVLVLCGLIAVAMVAYFFFVRFL